MNDNLYKAADSLSEQTKKFKIASYYTHGDSGKAKEMLAGSYKDIYAIKVKFSASSIYGAFLCFFSIPYSSLIDSYVIVSQAYGVDDIKTNIGWKVFEKMIEDNLSKGEHDNEYCLKLKDEVSKCFTIQMSTDQRALELKRKLELDDEIAVNRIFKKFIIDKLGFLNVNISVDFEQISSLDMELYSISNKKIDLKEIEGKEEEEKEVEFGKEMEIEDDDEDIGEEFQGFGLLRIDGHMYCGQATMTITDDTIQMECDDQIATWDIVNQSEIGCLEYIYGQGDLGSIRIKIFHGKSSSYILAFGTGVFFCGKT